MNNDAGTKPFFFNMSSDLYQQLKEECAAQKLTMTQVVNMLVAAHFAEPEPPEAPPTPGPKSEVMPDQDDGLSPESKELFEAMAMEDQVDEITFAERLIWAEFGRREKLREYDQIHAN